MFAQKKPAFDFTEDPFKDYRYEDPFNIEDPFTDIVDGKKADPFARPTSVAGFGTDFFSPSSALNGGGFNKPERASGRVSAPPVSSDPFSARANNNEAWAAWPKDNWAIDDAWTKPEDVWSGNTAKSSSDWKTDNWANKSDNWANKSDNWATKSDNWATKSDNWAPDWDSNANTSSTTKNLNETWPTNTLPSKKEKSPKPVKYARSLVHTIGGIGRTRHNKDKKSKSTDSKSSEVLPTEEQQLAWAAAESKRLEVEAEARRRQEDAELQLALAISRQEK